MSAQGRGRPRGTSRREIELMALELFAERGFEETTVDDIASRAGVSRRTFFRYFPSKADAIWYEFDAEVDSLRESLATIDEGLSLLEAIRTAVIAVNRYTAADVAELRTRMRVINSSPALQATASLRYDAWERAVADFAARRLRLPGDSLEPLLIGRTTLAACRAAYELWTERADADLTVYLDRALKTLARLDESLPD